MNLVRPLRCAVAAAALVVAAASRSSADLALDVSPAKYELQVGGGQSQTIPITVRNAGDAPVHVLTSLSDFNVGRDGQYAFFEPGKTPYGMGKWVTVNPREFDLEPKAFVQVRFSVTVPQGAAGEYSSIVFFTTRPPRHAGAGVAIAERVASKLYNIVPSTERFGGEIDDVSARPDSTGYKYVIGFRNTGNAHVYLNGRVEVKQNGQTLERIPMPKEMLVERSGKRLIEAVGKKLAPGSYTAVALVDYGGPNLIAGQTQFTVR